MNKTQLRATSFIKSSLTLLIGGAAILSIVPQAARAQEASRTLEQVYQFDERGDAKVEFKFELGKAHWDMWKMRFGDHPDEMLRTINHDMAAAVIDEFALDRDDIHRRATARFKARAAAQYRGNGQFEVQVPKAMKFVTGSGLEWVFTSSSVEETPQGKGIVETTYRAKLPAQAQNAHIINGNDFNRLAYTVQVSTTKPKTLLYLGALLLVGAIILALVASRAIRRTAVYSPPLPPSTPTALPRS